MEKVLRGIWEQVSGPEIPEGQWTEVWTGSISLISGGTFYLPVEPTRPTRYTFSDGLIAEGRAYQGAGESLGMQIVVPGGKTVTGPNTLLAGSASFDDDGNWTGVDVRIQIDPSSRRLTASIEIWGGDRGCWASDRIILHGTLTLVKIEQA